VLAVGSAGEVLAYQPGQEQQRVPWPVVGRDVVRLPAALRVTRTTLLICSPRTRVV
jgi:hypothetical protein